MRASNSQSLTGQTAVVTGASSGIGSAIARELGNAGANVTVNYFGNRDGADAVVDHITRAGGQAIAIKADVSNKEDVAGMFQLTIKTFGTIDILISNAGVQQDAAFVDMTVAQWHRVIDINLTAAFLCAQEAVREFIRRGMIPERSRALGKIIFISSVHEIIPWAGHVNYAASKGGLMLFMKSIAQELGPQKIRINSIAPGAINTPINRSARQSPEAERELLNLIPYKRVGEPAEIARVALWLASDESDYIHGTSLLVDGGMALYPAFTAGG